MGRKIIEMSPKRKPTIKVSIPLILNTLILWGCGMFSKDYPVALPSGALVDKRNTLPYRQDQAAKAETGTDILKH